MYELCEFIKMQDKARKNNVRKACGLLNNPNNGIWFFVGSIPFELCEPDNKSLTPDAYKSKYYNNKQEAINALEKLGYKSDDGLNYYQSLNK